MRLRSLVDLDAIEDWAMRPRDSRKAGVRFILLWFWMMVLVALVMSAVALIITMVFTYPAALLLLAPLAIFGLYKGGRWVFSE